MKNQNETPSRACDRPGRARTVRSLIDEMAESRGDALFLLDPECGRRVSFAQLRVGARNISHSWRQLGLVEGDKAAFSLENGIFTAELFLGALYGGFVPVPLNPAASAVQFAWQLHHSDARLVVVPEEAAAMARSCVSQFQDEIRVVTADPVHGPAGPAGAPETGELPEPRPEDDALLIYTSGSTGQPKGVVLSHQNLVAGGENTWQAHQLTIDDRSLCVLPLHHLNAQVVTLLATLRGGGSVVMPGRFQVAKFWEWLGNFQCTWAALVPTIIAQLVEHTGGPALEQSRLGQWVRFMRSSAAPLPPDLHRRFEEKFGLVLIEAMGSTEAGGAIFSNPLPPRTRKAGSPGIPCGFEVRIADEQNRELPRGQPGEILLRGPSVMKEYYKNSQATAAVLDAEGWLRTGDIGRLDDDGYCFVVGRSKELIIKGGENIAPKEIDEALMRHPAVLEAAARGIPDAVFGEDIVAHVVPRNGVSPEEQDLLDWCVRELGAFKTPSRILFCDHLPKGPTGKVQRHRLAGEIAAREQPTAGTGSSSVAGALCRIWAEVLDVGNVDIHDNFFHLGGHSLLAARVVARVRRIFQVALPLREVFQNPTVARLSPRIEILRQANGGGLPPPLTPASRDCALPLTFAQERAWRDVMHSPEKVEAYIVARGFLIGGPLDAGALRWSFGEIVRRHEILRTTFPALDDRPVQSIHPPAPLDYSFTDLEGNSDVHGEAESLEHATALRPMNLARGPLLRFQLLRLREHEHRLLMVMHHILCDHGSLDAFFRELEALYAARCRGETSPLRELPVQMADFAVWQRQRLHKEGEAYQDQLAWWQKYWAGKMPAPMRFSFQWNGRPPVPDVHDCLRSRQVPRQTYHQLRELGHRHDVTLAMILLAAVAWLLHQDTRQEEIVIGSYVSDQPDLETGDLIGHFTNLLALRVDFRDRPTLGALLGRVRDMTIEAYARQSLPFDELGAELEACGLPRPQVQVIFHLVKMIPRQLSGLTIQPLPTVPFAVPWGMSITARESENSLEMEVNFDAGLYDPAGVAGMLEKYQALLEAIVANPDLASRPSIHRVTPQEN